MSFGPVRPARIDFDSSPGAPRSIDYDDIYASREGALAQAEHVFLRGNGLPERWRGRSRFVILETGFGLGNNFLATWAAWRADAQHCDTLWFVSIEKHPPARDDLARAQAGSPLRELADALVAQWPPPTPDWHGIDFDQGRVRLLLAFGDIAAALPELVLRADAIYLDGFAPARNPAMWDARQLRHLKRLAAPGATLATWCVAREMRDALTSAGFAVEKARGFGAKREMTVARFAPRFIAEPPPGRRSIGAARRVTVVGAGLAGAAVAHALALQGIEVELLEGLGAPAAATSSIPAALFHGTVHRADGMHARWLRAAALRMQRVLAPLVARGLVSGAVDGLLRAERALSQDAMQAVIDELDLPPDWVRALGADAATARSGVAASLPAWHYPGGGWAAPAALVRHWLSHPAITLRAGQRVDRLQDIAGPVVLANAADALRLLDAPAWPHEPIRGQLSVLPANPARHLQLPLTDGGYALQLPDGRIVCGATAQPGDTDSAARASDDLVNLATLTRLTGWAAAAQGVTGHAGIRLQSGDRLPWIGPVPLPSSLLQARQVPRRENLYILAALGSRGLTHAALAGELLAAWITGAPLPVPASLADAVDPARFGVRAGRRRAATASAEPALCLAGRPSPLGGQRTK